MKERTIVACISIPVCAALVALGHDGAVLVILSTIVGWYFGRESSEKEAKE